MKFGPLPIDQAEGAILAHSLRLPDGTRLAKGTVIGAAERAALGAHGVREVTVARLDPRDLGEDAAAWRLASAMVPDPKGAHLRLTKPAHGRVNLIATAAGVVGLDAVALTSANGLDPSFTLATLRPFARVAKGTMIATVKIIPYGVPEPLLAQAEALAAGTLRVHPVRARDATLIQTSHDGSAPDKGERAIAMRLERLGMRLAATRTVPHETAPLVAALAAAGGDIVLLLTASATSDADDVGPAALRAAGGTVTRFGLPVDPGNLLFVGTLGAVPVIGLPGCARSPALNGADWVLERMVCGLPPSAADYAAMGVGGLLKDTTRRGHPRG